MTQPMKNIALSPYGYVPRKTKGLWFGMYKTIIKILILVLAICFLIISGCSDQLSKQKISTSSNTLIQTAYLIVKDSLK